VSKSLWTSHLRHLQSYRTTHLNSYLEVHQWLLLMWLLTWRMLPSYRSSYLPMWRQVTSVALLAPMMWRMWECNRNCLATKVGPTSSWHGRQLLVGAPLIYANFLNINYLFQDWFVDKKAIFRICGQLYGSWRLATDLHLLLYE
jgi:hypothetical protein